MPDFIHGPHTLHYEDQGHGSTVVLLHSSGMSHRQWRAQARLLSARARVLCPDLLGAGDSSPAPEHGTLQTDVAVLGAWLTSLASNIAVAGHSYGGLVALHLAHAHPERILRLAVYEPVAFGVLLHGGSAPPELVTQARLLAQAPDGGSAAWLQRFVDYWQGEGAWAALSAEGKAMMVAGGPAAFFEVRSALQDDVTPGLVSGIKADTLIIAGTRSPTSEHDVCRALVAGMPKARLHHVEGAGHMGPLTHAVEVGDLLQEHLLAQEQRSA